MITALIVIIKADNDLHKVKNSIMASGLGSNRNVYELCERDSFFDHNLLDNKKKTNSDTADNAIFRLKVNNTTKKNFENSHTNIRVT